MRNIIEKSNENLIIVDIRSRLLQGRIMWIEGPIDETTAVNAMQEFMYLNSISHDEIEVYINSPGGSINQGLAIYDVAMHIESPIKTICLGQAASMGAILMLMGEKRLATKNSRLMLHQISGGVSGNQDEMKAYIQETELLQNTLYEIIKEKTLITNPEEAFKLDKWYSAQEAVENGLLTGIL